ncbi:MAG: hypothetical protein P8Y83_10355, partial [Gammaproteobacteria bacterium]
MSIAGDHGVSEKVSSARSAEFFSRRDRRDAQRSGDSMVPFLLPSFLCASKEKKVAEGRRPLLKLIRPEGTQ